MAEPLGRAQTRALLERHGVRLKSSLGQHFLAEPNTVRRIVEISGVGHGSQVLEIGAGAGTLTRALADTGASVIAYEVDEGLEPVLDEVVGDAAEIRFEDAASVDFGSVLPGGEWTLVANLPYNVGTPILLTMLREVPRVTRFVVMLQKEAVDRLAAAPGSKTYGVPSVIVALHGSIDVVLRVPPHLFVPRPKVESAVALIDRLPADPASERAIQIAAAAFGQRRKMVRASLRRVFADPSEVFAEAGIDPTARAEDLAPADFLRLAAA
ncbi:MAG TPA: 16S rRNA (adenine(1518)-N(6)/adenine(1519)-N(6))-dimethyltransferase RsmA [Acidimicrobiia bacterium]|nr:16S rRNA (adenine(1518)-N(6)/adenine(1519)-N(6))-dimethyltransferase RsmA [Acidimicrobiia bacterium]